MKLSELNPNPEELDKYLWEMANLAPDTTGIPRVMIWATQARDGARLHGPSVKVSAHRSEKTDPNDLLVLTIQDNPRVVARESFSPFAESFLPEDTLEDIKAWVSENKDVLLLYWRGIIATDELLQRLHKL